MFSLDTNVISDILRGRKDVIERYAKEIKLGNEIAICDIAYYELFRGLKSIGATSKIKNFMNKYEEMIHLPLDKRAIEKAIEIYLSLHKGQQIEDNDIYIAAASIVNDCVLVTANERHFSRIEGLKYVNWRNDE